MAGQPLGLQSVATAGPRERVVPGLRGNHRGESTLLRLSSLELATLMVVLVSEVQKEGVTGSIVERVTEGTAPSLGVCKSVEEAEVRPFARGTLKLKTISQRL